jgi:hypothetical protein
VLCRRSTSHDRTLVVAGTTRVLVVGVRHAPKMNLSRNLRSSADVLAGYSTNDALLLATLRVIGYGCFDGIPLA